MLPDRPPGEGTRPDWAENRQLESLEGDHRLVAFGTDFRCDYLGMLEWMRYPDGEELSYSHDKGGQVKAVTGEKRGQSRNSAPRDTLTR